MMHIRSLSTCGGAELTGMNGHGTPTLIMKAIVASRSWHGKEKADVPSKAWGRAFYVMSFAYDRQVTKYSRTKILARRCDRWKAFVEKHHLGSVIIAPDSPNPVHSGDTLLRSLIWTPDMAMVWKYVVEHKLNKKPPSASRGWG